MPRPFILLVLLLLPSCAVVHRDFRAPLTLETQGARRPAPGETGVFEFPMPLWPTLDALRASAQPNRPSPRLVEGPFVILQSFPDPAWFAYGPEEFAFVEFRVTAGPDANASGWLTSVGPVLLPGYADSSALVAPSGPGP